jgi:uncharacterized protein YdhG (YjbR/CyaY superfamily)
MEENKSTFKTIDEYISQCPSEIQETLQTLRKVIKECEPQAEEKISWQMPTFVLHGNLVHFAAFKNHIGLYPGPNAIEAFKNEISGYKSSKGAVQFPIGKPMPYELISRMVKFSALENIRRAEEKLKNKK